MKQNPEEYHVVATFPMQADGHLLEVCRTEQQARAKRWRYQFDYPKAMIEVIPVPRRR